MAAKIVAPKSATYDATRSAKAQKIANLKAQKGKANRSQTDRDALLDQLIDLITTP